MSKLPLAVTVGFSGPCHWLSEEENPAIDSTSFQAEAKAWLVSRLKTLPEELGLLGHHFLSGISQIAVGGDQAFTEACRDLAIPQRILLPQPSDVFLSAIGSKGPDFSEEEKDKSRNLLASPHIIQEKVASGASERNVRFEETNIELVRQSDVIIAIIKKEGGKWTNDLITRAARWDTPVLIVKIDVKGGKPHIDSEWQSL